MGIKLVACDLDGTLLTDDLRVSPRTLAAVRRAREGGVRFCIATGRMFCSALRFARQMALDTPLIAYNGALIKDAGTGLVYRSQPLDTAVAAEVLEFAGSGGLYVQKYVNDNLYVEKLNEKAIVYSHKVGVEAMPQGAEFYRLDEPPEKLLFIVEPDEQPALMARIRELFAGRAAVTSSSPRFIEIVHPGVNKGVALDYLARLYALAPEQIMACGDSYNDLEMLAGAGVAVAMGNAAAAVRSAAGFVTASNDEDGVAVALEKFVL